MQSIASLWCLMALLMIAAAESATNTSGLTEEAERRLKETCPLLVKGPNDEINVDGTVSGKRDSIWYEITVEVWASEQIACVPDQWRDVANVINTVLDLVDLSYFGITRLGSHVCHEHPIGTGGALPGGTRMLASDALTEDGGFVMPDEDIPIAMFRKYTGEEDLQNLEDEDAETRRRLRVVFHLFFRGGGKCVFCNPDNGDRRALLESKNLEDEPIEGVNEKEEADPSENQHRKLMCGGCHMLDFSEDGSGNPIQRTWSNPYPPYIDTDEYWDSMGVKINVQPFYAGYAPGGRARIYDTSFWTWSNWRGDPDLGSPNRYCPGGGPGYGYYGRPTIRGKPNPNHNCDPQGNVLIIQESNKRWSDDNIFGGTFYFEFKYPVYLKQLGLFDIDYRPRGDEIKIIREDGSHSLHAFASNGDNSVETVELNVRNVKKLELRLRGPGAVRFINFCHECPLDREALRLRLANFYPSSLARSFENSDSVSYFRDILIPGLEYELSQVLTHEVRLDSLNSEDKCFYDKEPTVEIKFTPSTPVPAQTCNGQK